MDGGYLLEKRSIEDGWKYIRTEWIRIQEEDTDKLTKN